MAILFDFYISVLTKMGNMIKFLHLFKNYYLGISFIGIAAFVIQEIPYIVMPLIKPASNPIMNMSNEIKWIGTVQGIFGILSMILMILINFIGWILYYMGYQYGWLIIITQFAVVSLYYLFLGLWQRNYLLAGTAVPFFVIHTINGIMNFAVKR